MRVNYFDKMAEKVIPVFLPTDAVELCVLATEEHPALKVAASYQDISVKIGDQLIASFTYADLLAQAKAAGRYHEEEEPGD